MGDKVILLGGHCRDPTVVWAKKGKGKTNNERIVNGYCIERAYSFLPLSLSLSLSLSFSDEISRIRDP